MLVVDVFFRNSQTDAASAAISVSGSRYAGTSGTGVPLPDRLESPPPTHPGWTTTVYFELNVGAAELQTCPALLVLTLTSWLPAGSHIMYAPAESLATPPTAPRPLLYAGEPAPGAVPPAVEGLVALICAHGS